MPAFTLTPGSPALTIVSTGNILAITTIDGGTSIITIGGPGTPTLSQTGSAKSILIDRPKTLTLANENTYVLSSGGHTLVGTY